MVLGPGFFANQATRKGFKPSTQYDVVEVLAVHNKALDFLYDDENHGLNLLEGALRHGQGGAWNVQSLCP